MEKAVLVNLGYVSYKTDLDDTDRARLFGELLKLAEGTLKAFRSDLYHDALWIHENVTGQGSVFFYGVRESATSIGKDRFAVTAFNTHSWRVAVSVVDGRTILECAPL